MKVSSHTDEPVKRDKRENDKTRDGISDEQVPKQLESTMCLGETTTYYISLNEFI